MFERALVAVDISPATEALVSALPGLRELGTEEVALVHVAKPVGVPVSRTVELVEDVRDHLEEIASNLRQEGLGVTVDVPTGAAAPELVRVAGEWDPSFIVVGSRSHMHVPETFVGSVAWEVVRRARRPVFIHRLEATGPHPELTLTSPTAGLPGRVIHPTDFSQIARRARPWVEELAARGVTSFTLIHALSGDDEDAREAASEKLEALASRLMDAGAGDVEVVVEDGAAADLVLERTRQIPDSMVVMGTHGRGFVPEMVLGSESRRVLRKANVSVLLIPGEEDAAGEM